MGVNCRGALRSGVPSLGEGREGRTRWLCMRPGTLRGLVCHHKHVLDCLLPHAQYLSAGRRPIKVRPVHHAVPRCAGLCTQAEAELEALRSELQQQQQELSKRAEALAAAAREGAAQVSGCQQTCLSVWGCISGLTAAQLDVTELSAALVSNSNQRRTCCANLPGDLLPLSLTPLHSNTPAQLHVCPCPHHRQSTTNTPIPRPCPPPQAAWIEAERGAAQRAEARAADLAAKEARLAAKEEALAAQQQVTWGCIVCGVGVYRGRGGRGGR